MIDNKISFAEFIKNEILEFNWKDEQLDILFYSFLKSGGVNKKDGFSIGISLKDMTNKIVELFERFYNVTPIVKELESKVNFIVKDESFNEELLNKERTLELNDDELVMAFVAGAFVARGWISKPSSRFYHLEIRIGSIGQSLNLQEAIDSLGIEAKTHTKGKWYITYIKKSMMLSDLLRAMHAQEAMMIFEEERINRDFASTYNKMQTIEEYNSRKIEEISEIQINAIKKLMETKTWLSIKPNYKNVAEIRLNYPNYSISDIQYTYNSKYEKDYSKSTINNWLKTLVEMSKGM